MRLLVPIRVSRDDEAGDSPVDQRDTAIAYADTRPGIELIFTDVIDYDVSGKTPIAERPGMKEWLQPNKVNEWDAIGGSEMSRISRDMRDYLNFIHDVMDKRGKIVIDFSDGTDSSTLCGRQTLEDRVLAATRYRQFVSEKRAAKAQRLSDLGGWDGGRISFGYRPVQRRYTDDFGKERTAWFLVRDTEGTAIIAERMVEDAFAGKSNRAIAAELNAEGITTTLGKDWQDSTVRRVLTSPSLAGFVVKMNGGRQEIRRGRDGQPVRFTDEPVISEERWADLQDVLQSRGRHRGQPQARHMLWDVAFCRDCSQPCEDDLPCAEHDVLLYGYNRTKHAEKGNRYYCKQCGFGIDLAFLESYVEWRLLREQGRRPLLEARTIRGGDDSADIIRLERQIERLRRELDADPDDADIAEAIRKREVRVAELNAGPREPDRIVWVPVEPAVTIGEHWASLATPKERNDYLRNTVATFYVDKDGVIGQLGWMALDDPNAVGAGMRRMMRQLRMPLMESWSDVNAGWRSHWETERAR